ncbi:50S ribosomal protein L16 [Candidatus Woesearchaeota archaeon]|nr:50S ribosomal protein L16 [Candidatus Woesearchaeota archaeon]
MARLRKGISYRRLERPYTRVSKYKKRAYIKANPAKKIVRFNMGDQRKKFQYTLSLKARNGLQIRDNALESARMSSNRILEALGPSSYFMRVSVYPFHILRENPLATGAGADRFSTGMQKAFGKPIGNAARIKAGQTMFEIRVDGQHLGVAKGAMKRIAHKLPCSCIMEIAKNND